MKKLRELAEKIEFTEGSSQSVQDALLRHLVRAHDPQSEPLRPKQRRQRRQAPLAEMESPQQLAFDFGDAFNKKT